MVVEEGVDEGNSDGDIANNSMDFLSPPQPLLGGQSVPSQYAMAMMTLRSPNAPGLPVSNNTA
jgi:hypothetical protein